MDKPELCKSQYCYSVELPVSGFYIGRSSVGFSIRVS